MNALFHKTHKNLNFKNEKDFPDPHTVRRNR
jgi:hypothetical protein